ncbi:MAG: alpha/beta fold hydrolase [Bacteroidetes bacterium]|nr:alpha/beta fold hydrolase [Bacteroidota bacterium]MBS1539487.1 alpha/beta fold hydrolase [Bacteroidota bacterium]
MKLFFRQQGKGEPLIILHGLLGSSDNWHSLAKFFADYFSVFTLDQRNHGLSPHSNELNYKVLTEDLEDFMKEHAIEKANLIGHSMGGKTVMNFAVKNPSKVNKLVVVDIVPKHYVVKHDSLVEGMKAIPLNEISSRSEAEVVLAGFEPQPAVRQFLLKNLARDDQNKFFWRPNLNAIDEHLQEVGEAMHYTGIFDKPTLFVFGKKSNYFVEGDEPLIKKYFPSAKISFLDTGHWVQAERPQDFSQMVLHFLNEQ